MLKWFKLDPIRVGSVAAAAYAAGSMLYRAFYLHTGVFEPDVLVAGIGGLYGLFARTQTTSLANPKNAQGLPLRTGQR